MSLQLEQMSNLFNLDEQTTIKARELLSYFLSSKISTDEEKIFAPCSIYVACQIVVVHSVMGTETYGNGVTLTQIIKWLDDSFDIEQFFSSLQIFIMGTKRFIPETIHKELDDSVIQASMSFRIYKKFDKSLSMIGINRIKRLSFSHIQSYVPTLSSFNSQDMIDQDSESFTPIFNKKEQKPQESDQEFQQEIEIENDNERQKIDQDENYLKSVKNLSWIMFLLLKEEVKKHEEINQTIVSHPDLQNTLLIIAHISQIVISLPQGYTCQKIISVLTNADQFTNPQNRVLESSVIIHQVFLLVASYGSEGYQFEEDILHYMQLCSSLIQKMKEVVLRRNHNNIEQNSDQNSHDFGYNGLLEPSLINSNYRKFHNLYVQKNKHSQINLDEESFLRQKVVFTPHKPSQSSINRIHYSPENLDIVKKKIKPNDFNKTPVRKLSDQPLFHQTPMRRNQFSENFKQHAQLDKKPITDKQVSATPISKVLLQYEWLKRITHNMSDSILEYHMNKISDVFQTSFERQINDRIRLYVENQTADQLKIKSTVQALFKFYIRILEHMIINEQDKQPEAIPSLLQNKDFTYALLAISIATDQHIRNKEVNIMLLLECCNITTIELWRIISNFANFQDNIPQSITQHLFDLENKLLLKLIWQDQYQYMISILNKNNNPGSLRYFEIVLLRRLQNHFALRVTEMAQVLDIDNQVRDQTWHVLSQIMDEPPNNPNLWKNRHLDMFILCTFYMIMKQQKKSPEFKKFRNLYGKKFSPEDQKQVFNPLIKFYNEEFLQISKKYLQETHIPSTPQPKYSTPGAQYSTPGVQYSTPGVQYKIFNSPLPQAVPRPFLQYLADSSIQSPQQFKPFKTKWNSPDISYQRTIAARLAFSQKKDDK